jgi:hypothetical protein
MVLPLRIMVRYWRPVGRSYDVQGGGQNLDGGHDISLSLGRIAKHTTVIDDPSVKYFENIAGAIDIDLDFVGRDDQMRNPVHADPFGKGRRV